ncbi:MAG: PEGA domain-containing protein [Deltaproteobacteria bacterium]|nr:PEGA domain-containing protein [Deltaproteobacteria bacterium]
MSRSFRLTIGLLLIFGICPAVWAQTIKKSACSGWIAVESVPVDGAAVTLDGKDTGLQTPATLKNVPCGTHTISVSKLLYVGGKKKLKVSNQEVVKARLALKPNFASVEITTRPVGAHLVLDGKSMGDSPLKIQQLEAGQHEVKASFPDHQDVVRKFVVKKGKRLILKIRMKASFGKVVIKAKPESEASVFVDGDELGSTPLTLKRVLAGTHTIEVTKDMYRPYKTKIKVVRGKTTIIVAKLKPNYGTLFLSSKPSGALVTVDGRQRGKTPLSLRVKAGQHKIAFQTGTAAYGKVEKKVKVVLGKKIKLAVRLPVRTGSLMIDTVPFAAKIELDGKLRGTAPLSLKKIPVGVHVIVARGKGQESLTGRIEVLEGKTAVAEINLADPDKSVYSSGGKPSASRRPDSATVAKATSKSAPAKEKKPDSSSDFEPMTKSSSKKTTGPKTETKPVKETSQPKSSKTKKISKAVPPPERKDLHTPPVTVAAGRPMSTWRLLAWVSTGTAGATAVTSIILFAVGASKQSEADDAWANAESATDPGRKQRFIDLSKDLDEQAAGMSTGGWVMAGLTLAAGGAALYFFLTELETETQAALQFNPLPGGGWVGIGGRF